MELKINISALIDVAGERGWLHESGRLAGTLNAAKAANALDVATSTVTRAYATGQAGMKLISRLHDVTGRSFDELIVPRAVA